MYLFNLRKNRSDSPRKKDGLALIEVHAHLKIKSQMDYFIIKKYVFSPKTQRDEIFSSCSHMKRTECKCYLGQK